MQYACDVQRQVQSAVSCSTIPRHMDIATLNFYSEQKQVMEYIDWKTYIGIAIILLCTSIKLMYCMAYDELTLIPRSLAAVTRFTTCSLVLGFAWRSKAASVEAQFWKYVMEILTSVTFCISLCLRPSSFFARSVFCTMHSRACALY